MYRLAQQSDSLERLIKVANTIINDINLLEEMVQEVKDGSLGPICSMFKSMFKKRLLENMNVVTDFIEVFFLNKSITEVTIFESNNLGIKCFFMPKGSMFPLHDHNNKVVITGVLYGRIKYMTLNKSENNWYQLSSKGTADESKVLFATRDYRNIHSLVAAEHSIILDIFMPNDDDSEEFNIFQVLRKRERNFFLKRTTIHAHRQFEDKSDCF